MTEATDGRDASTPTLLARGVAHDGGRPLVSVVTPFYNTAQYLEMAIRSVLAQDYGNFEYVLADNCSTDGSLEIAQRFAVLDSRVRVVTYREFIDQDANYNRALGCISPDSRWCKIVQADDWIYPQCLSEMVSATEHHPRVAIVGCCYLAGDTLAGHGLPFDRVVFPGAEACRVRLLKGGTYFGSPTCLLLRSDIVRLRESFYEPGHPNADTMACFEILGDADFARVPQILAYLRRGNSSISAAYESLEASYFVNLALVRRYGPRFLEPGEQRERQAVLEKQYWRALARAALTGRGREYWRLHTALCKSSAISLPWGRIVVQAMYLGLAKLLNPLQTIESLLSALQRR